MIIDKCPKCNSTNLSSDKYDFFVQQGIKTPYRFCLDCRHEWPMEKIQLNKTGGKSNGRI